MENSPKLSASVLAAAAVALLGSVCFLLGSSLAFTGILARPFPSNSPELPPFMRTLALVLVSFTVCVSIFGIATAIGLFLLRNWARISILIWAGFSAFFGALGIPVIFLMPLVSTPNSPQLPADSVQVVRLALAAVYGVPLATGIWWLILFSRKSVKAQFMGAVGGADGGPTLKPRCPLPIAVLAWFYITLVFNFVFIPLLPFRAPVLLFGYLLPGNIGLSVLIAFSLTYVATGIGLLKLKPWSYSLAIALNMFWMASAVASLLSPNYDAVMGSFAKQIQDSFHLPSTQNPAADIMHHHGWAMAFTLVLGGAILGLLIYYRPRFLKAASANSL